MVDKQSCGSKKSLKKEAKCASGEIYLCSSQHPKQKSDQKKDVVMSFGVWNKKGRQTKEPDSGSE